MDNARDEINPQLLDILNRLTDHLAYVETKFQIYKCVAQCYSDDRVEVVGRSPQFFDSIQHALVDIVIIKLCLLFDKKAKKSLPCFLERLKSDLRNRKCRLASTFKTSDVVSEQQEEMEEINPILKNIRKQRDKYRAHHDAAYFHRPEKLQNDAPLSIEDIEKVIQVAQSILKTLRFEFLGVDSEMCPTDAHDVEILISMVQDYLKMIRDKDVLDVIYKNKTLL